MTDYLSLEEFVTERLFGRLRVNGKKNTELSSLLSRTTQAIIAETKKRFGVLYHDIEKSFERARAENREISESAFRKHSLEFKSSLAGLGFWRFEMAPEFVSPEEKLRAISAALECLMGQDLESLLQGNCSIFHDRYVQPGSGTKINLEIPFKYIPRPKWKSDDSILAAEEE